MDYNIIEGWIISNPQQQIERCFNKQTLLKRDKIVTQIFLTGYFVGIV